MMEEVKKPVEILIQEVEGVWQISFLAVRLTDELQVREIQRQVSELIKRALRPRLLLNFEQVCYLTSSMLGTLVSINKMATEAKGGMKLCGLRENLYEIFKITGLNRMWIFYPSLQEGMAAFKKEKLAIP